MPKIFRSLLLLVAFGVIVVSSGIAKAEAVQGAAPAAAAPAPVPATLEQAKPFLGDWIVTVQAPPGPVQFAFTVKVESDKVVAVINNEMMGQSTARDVLMDGKSLLVRYTADMMGNQAPVALWLTPQRLPPECEPVFDWLRDRNALTAALVEQRARALLANGQASFARTLSKQLPPERAAPLLQWADLLERPEQSLDRALADAATLRGMEVAALLGGWNRLARNDPEAARERFEQLAPLVGPENIGAYAAASSTYFNGFPPAKVVHENQ